MDTPAQPMLVTYSDPLAQGPQILDQITTLREQVSDTITMIESQHTNKWSVEHLKAMDSTLAWIEKRFLAQNGNCQSTPGQQAELPTEVLNKIHKDLLFIQETTLGNSETSLIQHTRTPKPSQSRRTRRIARKPYDEGSGNCCTLS